MSNLTFASRRVAAAATDVACRAVGRGAVIRAARYVLLRARLDYPNDMASNGERALQRWALDLARGGEMHVADVGANVGRWSGSLLAAAAAAGRARDVRLHAFEPEVCAFAKLEQSLAGANAVLNPVALSHRQGTSSFHVVAPAAGTNSLYPAANVQAAVQTIPTSTLDTYAADNRLLRFALVKIDTEGHDLGVLRGAGNLLAGHRIALVQFEYNHRWVFARAFLRDAFDLLTGFGYRIGKLTPRGIEFYPGWEPELETFVEGNYVACTPPAAELVPAVRWWKAG